ncbi:MAG: integrating conjugative element protein [Haliea sp.]|nr:integrating conjugative element protein [Haliea sp.]MAY93344.1 integrating conjugative element protein [Haliea sp.]MBP71246.1 integrating conjugative element protein [Haliea sp.]HCD56351.1 integrating conjugative element protein [Halieaceae bacterium]
MRPTMRPWRGATRRACSGIGAPCRRTPEMRRNWLFHFVGILTVLVPLGARAQLVVLHDDGRTQPLAPFLGVLTTPDAPPVPPAMNDLGAADPVRLLPLRSPGLTPGPVPPRPTPELYQNTLTRPVFLVGADPRSQTWLRQHRSLLLSLGAVGLLVQAETQDDLETMASIAAGLPLLPAAAIDLIEALALTHIPVLISRRGIEQ